MRSNSTQVCDQAQGRNEGQLATGVLGQAPGRVSGRVYYRALVHFVHLL